MTVRNTLKVIEVNGVSVSELEEMPCCEISSHWNSKNFVVIQIGASKVTLLAKEVVAAAINAQNTAA